MQKVVRQKKLATMEPQDSSATSCLPEIQFGVQHTATQGKKSLAQAFTQINKVQTQSNTKEALRQTREGDMQTQLIDKCNQQIGEESEDGRNSQHEEVVEASSFPPICTLDLSTLLPRRGHSTIRRSWCHYRPLISTLYSISRMEEHPLRCHKRFPPILFKIRRLAG